LFEHDAIKKYSSNEIPINDECLLMSEIYMQDFSNALVYTLESKQGNPYEVGYAGDVIVRRINENSIDMSWYPNHFTRFHEVSIIVPKDKIKECVGCWEYGIKPYIFVDKEWLEQLYTREYSVFALIDAIGAKNAIRNNLLTKEKLIVLRNNLDALAVEHEDISFISFADSLILKSNWLVGYFHKGIKCSYEPEVFLWIIKKIQEIYRQTLALEIYAVLTQGSNQYYGEPLTHISKNHICLNSLGIPFAELMAIERSAKKAIRDKIHPPAEVYMEEQYYHSLNLKLEFKENMKSKNRYEAIMKADDSFYFYSSCSELASNLAR